MASSRSPGSDKRSATAQNQEAESYVSRTPAAAVSQQGCWMEYLRFGVKRISMPYPVSGPFLASNHEKWK